jgi:hypothetical protein
VAGFAGHSITSYLIWLIAPDGRTAAAGTPSVVLGGCGIVQGAQLLNEEELGSPVSDVWRPVPLCLL